MTTLKIKILLPVIILTIVTACKKGQLDVTPPAQLSTTVFWQTESDADLALAGLYNFLYEPGGNWANSQYKIMGWDTYTDDCYTQHDYAGGRTANASGITPTSGAYVLNYYTNNYKAIAAINSFLANVDKVLTGEKLERYKAEAYFLRGFNYFWLAQLYGNVPIITENPNTINYSEGKAKSSRAEVYKLVEEDLDKAIASLPDERYASGHAVRTTAQGYKVRAFMNQHKFSEAAALAKSIIDGGKYSLHDNYLENFYKSGQDKSEEIMFSVKFLAPNIIHGDGAALIVTMQAWAGYMGTQNLYDEYEAGDPRRTMTFFQAGDGPAEGWPFSNPTQATPGLGSWSPGFYLPRKWMPPGIFDPTYGVLGDNDYVLLRYADIKLMYAEAQNEAVGPDASVYQQVNDVRSRPGVNMSALEAGLTQEQMREKIRHERRVEFPFEGLRYFDLRRWGIATQTLNGFAQTPIAPDVKIKYEDKYEFWPIPQTEIDRNKGALQQNPGY